MKTVDAVVLWVIGIAVLIVLLTATNKKPTRKKVRINQSLICVGGDTGSSKLPLQYMGKV